MKVALITFLYDPRYGGGAANSARRLALGLKQKGFDVVVISTHGQPGLKISEVDGIKVYYFLPRNLYWVAEKDRNSTYKKMLWQLVDIWNPHAYQQVRNILKKEQPDIVHVQKLRGLSPSVWSAARISGCQRIVQTCRDYELMSPEGTLSGRLGKYSLNGAWFIRPYQWFRSRLSQQVHVATAPSAYTLNVLTERGFFPNARQCVVPNTHGFDNEELDLIKKSIPAKRSPSKQSVRFLYLGRLEDVKGVDLLCAAFSQCVNRFPGIRLEIVGYGNQEEALRQAYNDNPNITFHGGLFGKAKSKILAACDVMVVPSIWPEVFGNVVVEAFAYGLPVVAAKSGGLPELIEQGVNGFQVAPNDLAALERALNKFSENPELSGEMSNACFAAAKRYSIESVTDKYLTAYNLNISEHESASIKA